MPELLISHYLLRLHYKEHEMGLDKTLLRFTLAFFLMYSSFTILKGAYSNKSHDHSNIYILNGVVEITQVILQVTFLEYFSQKVNSLASLILMMCPVLLS